VIPPPPPRPSPWLAAGLAAVLWLAATLPAAGDTTVRASLEPSVIGLGETAVFTVEVKGTGFGSVSFRPQFELDNLEMVSAPARSEDVSLDGTHLSRSFRISWRLRPLAVGKARVRSLRLQLGGEQLQMRDREITVQEAPTGQTGEAPDAESAESEDPFERFFGAPLLQPRQQPARQQAVFLRAETQPQRPWVGQQVLYTVYLFTRQDINSVAARDLPTFRGFWVRDVPQPQHLPTVMVPVGGEMYARVVVFQKALFPLRPGHYVLEPAAVDLITRVPEERFFGPAFLRPEQLLLRTPAMPIDVQPLPPPPPGFAGAVGQLALASHVEPPQLRLGEAATLTLTLSGRGNVQGVAEPRVAAPAGLRIFPPQQQGEESVAGTAVEGKRTWSYVVIPDRPGHAVLQIPRIPYFDPQAGQYRQAAAPPIELTILPPAAPAAPAGASAAGTAAATARAFNPRIDWRDWPRLLPWLVALPCGIALLVTLARRRRHHPLPLTATATPGTAAALEQRLREAADEPRPRQAACRLETAWREFLAARWEIPPGTPAARWGEMLRARGADPAAADALAELAGDLHYLRYAPQLSAADTLGAEALTRSRQLCRRLR